MITVRGYKKGTELVRSQIRMRDGLTGYFPLEIQYTWSPTFDESSFSEKMKGNINTWPSGYKDQRGNAWNQCSHFEGHGEVWLTPRDEKSERLDVATRVSDLGDYDRAIKEYGWTVGRPDIDWSLFEELFSRRAEQWLGVKWTNCEIASMMWQGRTINPDYYERPWTKIVAITVFCHQNNRFLAFRFGGSYYMDAKDPVDLEFHLRWSTQRYANTLSTGVVFKANHKNVALEELRSIARTEEQYACDIGFSEYHKWKARMFRDCINQCRDLTVGNTVAQVISDGLLMQALSSIAAAPSKELNATLSRLRKLKGKWGPQTVLKYSLEELQAKLNLASSLKLGWEYGVKAPLRDYIDIADFVWKNRMGFQGYFWNASVQRRSADYSDGMTHIDLVCGIDYDPFEASSFEHFMALINQVGLGILPSDIWDLIPLSFAVDWIININQFMEFLDARIVAEWIPITFAWRTVRCKIRDRRFRTENLEGNLSWELYDRHVSEAVLTEALPKGIRECWNTADMAGALSVGNADEAIALLGTFVSRAVGIFLTG